MRVFLVSEIGELELGSVEDVTSLFIARDVHEDSCNCDKMRCSRSELLAYLADVLAASLDDDNLDMSVQITLETRPNGV